MLARLSIPGAPRTARLAGIGLMLAGIGLFSLGDAMGKFLVATGQLTFSADEIKDHQAAHASVPPAAEATSVRVSSLDSCCFGAQAGPRVMIEMRPARAHREYVP